MTTMRFPVSLAAFGLALSTVLASASFIQPAATETQAADSNVTVVAYRGSGRFQW